MVKHHLIISGTGRAGTTFLVQLFTALGLDTGFTDAAAGLYSNCNAGMEWDIRQPDSPYIVKSPFLCGELDGLLEARRVVIDHAIIPVRDLYSAAESRRDVARKTDETLYPEGVPGGLWLTDRPERQEAVLAGQLYRMVYTLAKWDIPMTLLYFPRLVRDPEYLYGKIGFALERTAYEAFLEGYRRVARPELVHDFGGRGLSSKAPGSHDNSGSE